MTPHPAPQHQKDHGGLQTSKEFNGGEPGDEAPYNHTIDGGKGSHIHHVLIVVEHQAQEDKQLYGNEETLSPRAEWKIMEVLQVK